MIDPIMASIILSILGLAITMSGLALVVDFKAWAVLGWILLTTGIAFCFPLLSRLWIAAVL